MAKSALSRSQKSSLTRKFNKLVPACQKLAGRDLYRARVAARAYLTARKGGHIAAATGALVWLARIVEG